MTIRICSQQRRRALGMAIALLALCLSVAPGLGGESAAAGSGATSSATKKVSIRDFAFHPGTLTVAKGTQVTFSNVDGAPHTATDKGAFDTGRIKAGKSKRVTFTQKGTFAYHCKIHTYMKGKIVVQ